MAQARENFSKITTDEIFKKYGEPAKIAITGFREIMKKDGTKLIGVRIKAEPERLYFAGADLQNLYNTLLEECNSIDELNDYLNNEPFEVLLEWGKSYYGNRMVVVREC